MAKRILLLLESTDWIVMAGAYQRWKKHSVEAVIVPFNDEGLAQIGPDTTHLYLLTHGLPGVLPRVGREGCRNEDRGAING